MTKRKKIIIISAISLVVIVAVIKLVGGKNKTEYVTTTAEFGTIIQTVDATGAVSSAEDIKLNFKSTGRVSFVYINKGDKVSVGQTLATLDAGALSSQVLEAQANLEKILAGSTPEDVRISEITVAQKEQALVSAQNDLNSLISKQDTELQNLKSTAVVTLHNELIDADAALETIDDTLNYKDAEDELGALDSGTVDKALDCQISAGQTVAKSQANIGTINNLSTNDQTLTAISSVMAALNDTQACLSKTFDVLENSITSSDFTQSKLDTLKNDIQSEQATIQTSKSNLQTAQSNWTNKISYYNDQITKAEDTLAAAEDTLELAKAQLALKKADPENYEITAARARLAKAQANLADTIIRAPVNGTITKINNEIGEQTSLATPVIEMIGNSKLEIEVDIPESDIAKIEVGQQTVITLDSFGDDREFNGTVTFIDPAETIIQDVVYYQVKVQFDDGKDNVKPGMTANVTIKTKEKSNVLKVPIRAVKQKNGDKIVEILVGQQAQKRQVTTGLRGDEFYEILTGLSAGEQVITFVKNGK